MRTETETPYGGFVQAMSRVKDIRVKVIPSKIGNSFIRRVHYSGKVTQNSQLHFGAFLDGVLHGVMSFGPSLDKRKIIGLVNGTKFNGFLELNRMAFDDKLPRNSESRCISIALKMIKKKAPQIKWVISFADGTQCGDGTIYRASGFILSGIKISKNLAQLSDGSVIHKMTLESNPNSKRPELNGRSYYDITGGKYDFNRYVNATEATLLQGFQLRYIYFIDPAYRPKLTVPEIPFSEIEKAGARMYKGKRPDSVDGCTSSDQDESGGSKPTSGLKS